MTPKLVDCYAGTVHELRRILAAQIHARTAWTLNRTTTPKRCY